MTSGTSAKLHRIAGILLVLAIVAGSCFIWLRYEKPHEIVISPPSKEVHAGQVYIGGAVVNPGMYPLKDGDTVGSLLNAAGGLTADGDLASIEVKVSSSDERKLPQKININQAEAWLLKALPGVGEVRAQSIIKYRQANGPFRSTGDIALVEGIGPGLYEQIKDLITVTD